MSAILAVREPKREPLFTRELALLSAVVVIGTVMTILDATIVNVALARLGRDLHVPVADVQWVATGYLLAFAAVIPATGWASERFGARRVWLVSLAAFVVGSVLAGSSWSLGSLIVFRVLQGAGAGMILPLGQTLLAQAAGPQKMGRVMSVIGVPMLLAPIFGPVVGGALIDAGSWRWIFFVNLPVGVLAFAAALRLLPVVQPSRRASLDVRGLALLPTGTALCVFALVEVGVHGTLAAWTPALALVAGTVLVTAFGIHARRATAPLIDPGLFRDRAFATGAAVNFLLGTALFGLMLLLPLYFQTARGSSPLVTGLLLVPQGIGAACAMPVAGALTDRIGARRVVPVGIVLALAGVVAYALLGPSSPYWQLGAALFAIGLGLGSTIMPSMAVAYASLTREAVPRASSVLNVIQRVAGSVGTAALAVTLQRTGEFRAAFWLAFGIAAAALVPAVLLPRHDQNDG